MNIPPMKEDPLKCQPSMLSQLNEPWDEEKHKKHLFYTGPKEREEDE